MDEVGFVAGAGTSTKALISLQKVDFLTFASIFKTYRDIYLFTYLYLHIQPINM